MNFSEKIIINQSIINFISLANLTGCHRRRMTRQFNSNELKCHQQTVDRLDNSFRPKLQHNFLNINIHPRHRHQRRRIICSNHRRRRIICNNHRRRTTHRCWNRSTHPKMFVFRHTQARTFKRIKAAMLE